MKKFEILQELPKCDIETWSKEMLLETWYQQTCLRQDCTNVQSVKNNNNNKKQEYLGKCNEAQCKKMRCACTSAGRTDWLRLWIVLLEKAGESSWFRMVKHWFLVWFPAEAAWHSMRKLLCCSASSPARDCLYCHVALRQGHMTSFHW